VVVQPATISPLPLERPFDRLTVLRNVEGPHILNICYRGQPLCRGGLYARPREGINPPEADKPLPYVRFRVP